MLVIFICGRCTGLQLSLRACVTATLVTYFLMELFLDEGLMMVIDSCTSPDGVSAAIEATADKQTINKAAKYKEKGSENT